jgi:ABC-type glycerol-3-phosphate transport system substrate-binding protein
VYYNRKLFEENNIAVPRTQAELKVVIDKFNALGITPFETHFVDLWSIGNITMQLMINDIFSKTPNWGDQFRAGKVSYSTSPIVRTVYGYDKLIYDNTWKNDTFSLQQTNADGRMVQGKAAMSVSGSWSIQAFTDIDPNFDFGVFPFPNQTGDAKLIYEPNITFMKSATTKNSAAIDKILTVLTTDKDLGRKIFNQTKSASVIKGMGPTFNNPSQKDIDYYVARNQIIDANSGNLQLVWGGFQDENAKDIAAWLQGSETLDQALAAADSRRANSAP